MKHHSSITVRFADLDPFDHVNHARYFTYFESARIEALSAQGYGLDRLKTIGFRMVVAEASARFHRPVGLHDVLDITTEMVSAGRASSRWRQQASCRGELVADLEVRVAFTDPDGKPTRAPEGFREAMS